MNRIYKSLSTLVILVLIFGNLPASQASATRQNAQATSGFPIEVTIGEDPQLHIDENGELKPEGSVRWTNPCLLYGAVETPRRNAWLFAIDLAEDATQLFGEVLPNTHVSGLAVHPDTGELVALMVNQTGPKVTTLALVDAVTGAVTPIGKTEMSFGEGLSFRPTDSTLWAWWREHGLVRIDLDTAAVELVLAGDLAVSALSWDPTGAVLYLAGNRSLWKFEEGYQGFQLIAEPLPVLIGGMAMRGDGQLLLIAAAADADGLDLLVFDPTTGAVAAHLGAPAVSMETGRPEDEAAAFIAALTWPVACGNPSPGGEAELIQDVQIDKSEVCPGETIHVQVEAVHPEGGSNPVLVSINGLPGNERFLQFDGAPGPRMINVSAWTAEGYTDRETHPVEVLDCGPTDLFALVSVSSNPFHPYMVDFKVVNADEIAHLEPQYVWEFGDGTQFPDDPDENVTFVSHSYEDALQPDEEYASFEAKVTVQFPDGEKVLSTPKTVVLWNDYAANRKRGLIQPPTTYPEGPELKLSGSQLTAKYKLRNLEDIPLALTGQQIEYQYCNSGQDPLALPWKNPWEEDPLTIGPGEEWEDTLELKAAEVPEGVCDVALHIVGKAGTGKQVKQVAADLYFQLQRNEQLAQPMTDEAMLTLLNDLAAQGLVPDPDHITDEELYKLSQQGLIDIPPSTAAAASRPQPQTAMAAVDEPDCDGDVKIGCPCTPGETPKDLPDNISCQATEEFDKTPAHIANALKGDVILVSGCGMVSQMLRQLEPAQKYGHTGIMTKNYVEIAHSTSSDVRYIDSVDDNPLSAFFASFDEEVIQYGWPGIIRQDVEKAFSSVGMIDPSGEEYSLASFSAVPERCDDGTIASPPLVVKPPAAQASSVVEPPGAEELTVRDLLHEAAKKAADMATLYSNGNYRLYGYMNANIVDNSAYDDEYGEPATVCSSFVWHSLKKAGVTLEDGLDTADVERGDIVIMGAEQDDETEDGLYLYRTPELLDAGTFLWDYIFTKVFAEMGKKAWFLPIVPYRLANQMVNCFSLDSCAEEHRDDMLWLGAAASGIEGRTVSPDNILLWDPPTDDDGDGLIDHGVYGYSERMVYHPGVNDRVYRWTKSGGEIEIGTVMGTVTYQGQPMEGASVNLTGPVVFQTASGENGSFTFNDVPAGNYEIYATMKLEGGYPLSSDDQYISVIFINKPPVFNVPPLELPVPEQYRKVVFDGALYQDGQTHAFRLFDIDWSPMCFQSQVEDKIGNIVDGVGSLSCLVDPYSTIDNFWWQTSLGDSHLTIDGNCMWKPSTEDVEVAGNFSLSNYSEPFNITVKPGGDTLVIVEMEDKDYCLTFYKMRRAWLWLRIINSKQDYLGAALSSESAAETTDGTGAAESVEIEPEP